MKHAASDQDRAFQSDFENGRFLDPLRHREHLQLAFIYLVDHSVAGATRRIRRSIKNFLRHRGIDPGKYHETMTQAWMLAVRHFMEISEPQRSAGKFLAKNDCLLDSKIMLTHYSEARLFSDDARKMFLEPDLDPIPTCD